MWDEGSTDGLPTIRNTYAHLDRAVYYLAKWTLQRWAISPRRWCWNIILRPQQAEAPHTGWELPPPHLRPTIALLCPLMVAARIMCHL